MVVEARRRRRLDVESMLVDGHAECRTDTARSWLSQACTCACAGSASLALLPDGVHVFALVHFDCGAATGGHEGGLGLVETELIRLGAAA